MIEPRPPLVIYHANCVDGFTAAWAAYKFLPHDTEYRAMRYDESSPPLEDVCYRDVYVLDFSFDRDDCMGIYEVANKLVILDHHKTAQAELEGLPFAQFDMDRSGAMMAWQYFAAQPVPRVPFDGVPWLVEYVQDRDLWRHSLPRSKAVNAYIVTLEHTFLQWDWLNNDGLDVAADAGLGALAYVQMLVRKAEEAMLGSGELLMQRSFAGHNVPVINTTAAVSDVIGALAGGRPFAIGWWRQPDGKFVVSMRSRGESGVDVSEIAKQYGGGGHRNAAGFTTSMAEMTAMGLV